MPGMDNYDFRGTLVEDCATGVCSCFALCLNMQLLLFEEKIAVFVVCSYSVVPACDFNTVTSYR